MATLAELQAKYSSGTGGGGKPRTGGGGKPRTGGTGKPRTGGTGSGGGTSTSKVDKNKMIAGGFADRSGFTDDAYSDSPVDVPYREDPRLEESLTEEGLYQEAAFEQNLLENALAEATQQYESDEADSQRAYEDYEKSAQARDQAIFTGPFESGRRPGGEIGKEYRKSPVAEATLGKIFSGSRDPEILTAAAPYEELASSARSAQQKSEASKYRLELLQEAAASGMSLAEFRREILNKLEYNDLEMDRLNEERQLEILARGKYGGGFFGLAPQRVPSIEKIPGRDGKPDTFFDKRADLAARRKRNQDMLAALPESEMMDTPVQLDDEEILRRSLNEDQNEESYVSIFGG